MSINQVVLFGRVGRKIEVRSVGKSVVTTFPLAVEREYKDKDGVRKTDWITCELWGSLAEVLEKNLKDMGRLGVSGKLEIDSYTNNQNQKVYNPKIRVESISIVDFKQVSQNQNANVYGGVITPNQTGNVNPYQGNQMYSDNQDVNPQVVDIRNARNIPNY